MINLKSVKSSFILSFTNVHASILRDICLSRHDMRIRQSSAESGSDSQMSLIWSLYYLEMESRSNGIRFITNGESCIDSHSLEISD